MIRKLAAVAFVGAVCFSAFVLTGANEEPGGRTITIPFDNAFGLTEGGDLRVGGVKAGSTDGFDLAKGKICESAAHQGGPPRTCAIVKAKVTEKGFSSFRADASCMIRQQSLIGEYYVDCQPGQSKAALPNDTVSIDRTQSTIPADLVANVMRQPYRERLRLIIAELGTGLAGRPQDLAELLQKAHPGLRETSKTLNILAKQTTTIKNFISDSDTVVADLEHNKREVARWVDSAEKASAISASRNQDIEAGFQKLPRFLDELRPTMIALGDLTDKQTPLLQNLQRSAPALTETLTRLGPFADASRPSLRSLGDASDKGKRALRDSADEVDELRKLAASAPALGKPLRQLLQTADDRSRGRADSRYSESAPPSPDPTSVAKSKGKGFTAFEDLLNYVYWQALAINEFDGISHQLRVLLLVGSQCASYANADIAQEQGPARALRRLPRPVPAGRDEPRPDRGRRPRQGGGDGQGEEAEARLEAPRRRSGSTRHAGPARPVAPRVRAAARGSADHQRRHRQGPAGAELDAGCPGRPVRARAAVRPDARATPRLPAGAMTRGRGTASIVASPVLIGSVTTLIVVVAVFLAYNANAGLPFVPTYDVSAQLPSGANLVQGNEVRVGGFRVGIVDKIRAKFIRVNGRMESVAVVDLKLDKVVEPLAADTKVLVRPRSALGLKYVELTPGHSKDTFQAGSTIPLKNAGTPVEFDDLLNTFDEPTRQYEQDALDGYGDAFAGRGADLNRAIEAFAPFFDHLTPVMQNLNDPDTELNQFFKQIGAVSAQVRPVSKLQADVFPLMADTFDAITNEPDALRQTIEKNPPTLQAGIESFPVQRSFIEQTSILSDKLEPTARILPTALPTFNSALRIGTPVLRETPALNRETGKTFDALDDLVKNPSVLLALQQLNTTTTRHGAAAPVHRAVPDGLLVRQLLLRRPRRAHLRGHDQRRGRARPAEGRQHEHAGQQVGRLPGRPPGRRAERHRSVERLHEPGRRRRSPGRPHAAVRPGDRRAGQRRLPDRQHGLHRRPAGLARALPAGQGLV